MEPTLVAFGQDKNLELWLAFAIPALLFWVGIFLAKPKLIAVAVVSGTLGLGLAVLTEALSGWLGIQNTQPVFAISFQLYTSLAILLLVVLTHRNSDTPK